MYADTKKIVFLFPGQGVQTQGVIEYYRFLKNKDSDRTGKFIGILQSSLEEINPQAGFDALEILGKESSSSWDKTSFIQPLTYVLSILTYELVRDERSADSNCVFMLGHSFGAFSALTASDSLPLVSGARIVAARGKFMQEDSEKANNGMCAIIGLTEDKVNEVCDKTGAVIALRNAPSAFVVGCSRDLFAKVEQEAARLGAAKTIRLSTSGAFHTKAMQEAYQKFKDFLKQYPFRKPKVPIVTNMEGTASDDPEILKNDVLESMINSVNWVRMMNFLKKGEANYYIESGPGGSLSALSRMNGVERDKILHARMILERTSP